MKTIRLFLYFCIISFSANGFLTNFKASEINNYDNKNHIKGELASPVITGAGLLAILGN